MKILVVEDEQNIATAIKFFLSKHFESEKVVLANNGLEALKKLENESFDVVISDWNIPQKTGYDVLCEMRKKEKTKGIPFLMLTAEAEQNRVEMAIQAGADDYLIKPFAGKALIEKVSSLLQNRYAC